MADGLPGHLFDFYRLVKDAPWMGGNAEYSPLNEAFPYFFNGLVPLAYALDDERLKTQVLTAADYIISHQHEDGWIGTEGERDISRRNFWARYPLFLGLVQLVEVESDKRKPGLIIAAMHRFIELMHTMLSNGHKGYVWAPGDQFDEQWGRSRAADMVIALQWLYEHHPGSLSDKIHECMVHMYQQAYDWTYWFSEEVFIKDDLDLWPVELTNSLFPYVHGVNAGQGLKYGAVMRRLTHDHDLLNFTRTGVDWTFTYHGTPSGGIIGDEREAGLSPVRGVELCSVVETMFSLTYLQQALGDAAFAERAELAAFNALPAMVRPHWWAHQYVAQTNQPISHPLKKSPFWNVGPHGQVFGTEPNYPCCTVDFSQGYPKFLSASFVRDGNDGIAHALLGPAQVQTTTKSGVEVEITCRTNYPFSQLLTYTLTASEAFRFAFRVPAWTDLNTTQLWVNDRAVHLYPDTHTGMNTLQLGPGISNVEVYLGAAIRTEPRANDTIAIYHGALLYAVHVYHTAEAHRPARYPGTQAPDSAADWVMLPTSPWNLAIDESTLSFYPYLNREEGLPNPIWEEDAPPVMISALACEIDWRLKDGYAPNPPPRWTKEDRVGNDGQKPIKGGKRKSNRKCIGRAFMVGLRPYGSAKLHMAEIPTVDLSPGSDELWDPEG